MGDLVKFPRSQSSGGNGGDGSGDSVLALRVGRLEEDVRDIKSILKNIESRLTSIEISLAKVDGRIAGLEGRIAGLDSRLGALPTTWIILGIVFTTWGVGSGILIFAMRFLQP